MYNKTNYQIRFGYSKDFLTAREPHFGEWIDIGNTKSSGWNNECTIIGRGASSNIIHHKWLWVRDGTSLFDTVESESWSKKWLSIIKEPAKVSEQSWKDQLKRHGLK